MAVANFHYTTGISRGFKVYILEGQPSLRTEDRLRPVSNHRIPVYPIKRKLSPERHGPPACPEEPKRRRTPLTIEKASIVSERPKVSDRERIAKLPERLELTRTSSPSDHLALARALQRLFPASLRLAASRPVPLQPRWARDQATERPLALQRCPCSSLLPSTPTDEPLALIRKPHSSCMPADSQTPSPVPAARPTPSPVPTVRPTPSPVPTARPTPSPVPAARPTQIPVPTARPTQSPVTISPVTTGSQTPSPVPTAVLQQMRPSVITCVSNRNRPSTSPMATCPSQGPSSPDAASSLPTCDPVVEEHFRRSLGTRYCPPDSASALSVAGSVDDHFSKALGSRWLLIRQPATDFRGPESCGSSSPSSPNSRPGSTS